MADRSHDSARTSVHFERSLKVGDLLTSISVLIATAGLIFTWQKDLSTRNRQDANEVRTAAATALAKFDRWVKLSLSIFDEIQPLIVETTEKLDTTRQVHVTRDHFWKELNRARLETQKKILNEQLETAFVGLYGYNPKTKDTIGHVVEQFRTSEARMFLSLSIEAQKKILEYTNADQMARFSTAQLGNALREVADNHRAEYSKGLREVSQPIGIILSQLILKSDNEILRDAQPR